MAQQKTDTQTGARCTGGSDLSNPKSLLAKGGAATAAFAGAEEPDMNSQKKKDARRAARGLGKRVAASFIAQAIWKVLLWLMDQPG